jgi:hypothetical protein
MGYEWGLRYCLNCDFCDFYDDHDVSVTLTDQRLGLQPRKHDIALMRSSPFCNSLKFWIGQRHASNSAIL